jgi:hypothetical protein
MGLDLTPRNYLEMLTDEYREYLDNPLSMRKAINCCALSNALPEIITAHKNPADPPDAHKRKAAAYREQLRRRCEAHHTVRDFCDYGKHRKVGTQICEREGGRAHQANKGLPHGADSSVHALSGR